ncbi:MAG TPA: hypothetical protein VJ579_04885 [Candidatus Paceibacterota bacterium]|nr:hypothetical protein [Candidatus Paceibacterota bacterium]
MEQEDQKIEVQLKERLARIVPPPSSFKETKDAVTNEMLRRHILEKAPIPSPYQSVVSFIMNKTMLIGVPVAVVAVIALMFVLKPNVTNNVGENNKVAVAPVAEESVTPTAAAPTPAPVAPRPVANVDTSSIDSITAGFLADANMDAATVLGDQSDQIAVNAELSNYDTVKTTAYEIAI